MDDVTIDADEVEQQLPSGWWAENDGDEKVYAYAGTSSDPGDIPASLTVQQDDDVDGLWVATWCTPAEHNGRLHEPAKTKCGLKERVIEWAAGRAEEVDPI